MRSWKSSQARYTDTLSLSLSLFLTLFLTLSLSLSLSLSQSIVRRSPSELRLFDTVGGRLSLADGRPTPGAVNGPSALITCSSGCLSVDCVNDEQQLPERVVPSGYSPELWRLPPPDPSAAMNGGGPADPQTLLLSRQPLRNLTRAIQSVWNMKEGRMLGSGPGSAARVGESTSFPGFDLHQNDGVVTKVLASHAGAP